MVAVAGVEHRERGCEIGSHLIQCKNLIIGTMVVPGTAAIRRRW